MTGFIGFVATFLFLLGKLIYYFILLMIHGFIRLSKNISRFIRTRWQDIFFCLTLSILLAQGMDEWRDGVYIFIYLGIFLVSLLLTQFLLSLWRLRQKRVKILIRYAFRKGILAKCYIYSKEFSDR